ncbi:transposase [Rhodopseudomonas sp. BR0M22]|uniref:REP-associated tyrosine transposase n=1 Tax=Rhodopseudomonas sp. BR0M22 TaxID=2269369 RepID=UPI0013DFA07C|nr:transposase [Rhodopseudomonas sp. BR0M22]MCD0423881.1 transposase [Rubrivivax sp. JA1024]NEW91937.1 transposase [Rhodopseudomonas sp. BR0M22]
MVQYRRNLIPGGTFFFTVALADRRSTLLIDHIAGLRSAFQKARLDKPFRVDAMVVLPDHLHVIMTLPEADADFPGRWKAIKAAFSRSVAAAIPTLRPNRRGGYRIWQSRYWEHTVRDDADFERCANYIHFNPVKHGLVSAPRAWPYSSIHRYIREGILPTDWGGDGGHNCIGFGEPRE